MAMFQRHFEYHGNDDEVSKSFDLLVLLSQLFLVHPSKDPVFMKELASLLSGHDLKGSPLPVQSRLAHLTKIKPAIERFDLSYFCCSR